VSQQQLNRPPQYGGLPAYRAPTQVYRRVAPGGVGYGASYPPAFGQSIFGGGVPQYAPPPMVPAPRRRQPIRLVLIALIVVAVGAVAGLAVVSATSSTPTAQFQNDNYKVPPPDTDPPAVPQPGSDAQAEDWVTNSTFYKQSVAPPVRCNSQPINVTTASDDQLKSHFDGLMECLVRVWQPSITAAGFQIVRPTVTIYGDSVTTKCGQTGVNAFYCAGDQQVYYSDQLPEMLDAAKENKWTADVVMAHEFGHALQARTGIFVAFHLLGQRSGDKATDLLYSRRSETQADCLSGMFVRAVSQSLGVQQQDLPGIYAVYSAVGDDTLTHDPEVLGSHGLARSRTYWGQTGLANNAVASCNTFIAPDRLVR
jgi:predicted metalloprotease